MNRPTHNYNQDSEKENFREHHSNRNIYMSLTMTGLSEGF